MSAKPLILACPAVILLAVAGCGLAPESDYRADLNDRTRSVVMNYLIARGMAESYLASGRATRAGLDDVVRFDRAALLALRNQARRPTWTDLKHADQAIRALISTTTTLDQAAAPQHGPAAVAR